MRERLLVLALAAGALALFYILFLPHPQNDPDLGGLPISTETRPEGYQALWRWLKQQQIPAISLRQRYDQLPSLLRQPTGNVLIVTMPHRIPANGPELDDLADWVEQGNTLLVMAALQDTPMWALSADPLFEDHLKRLTGLSFKPPQGSPAGLDAILATRFTIQPNSAHPLTIGVRQLVALSALPIRHAELVPGAEVIPLELAKRPDSGETALWLTQRDAGQVIISGASGLFSNGTVQQADNAQLLSNILSWSLAPGGAVIFDDAHQGLSDIYDARKFFADPRLHHTLAWIVLLWLVFVLGSLPLRAAQSHWQPQDETAYVEGSARYLAAVVPTPETAQRLIENFMRRLTRFSGSDQAASSFELLDAHAGVSYRERALLRELYTRACAGRKVNLVQLQNLLSQLRRIFE